jgi:hypothetical protein
VVPENIQPMIFFKTSNSTSSSKGIKDDKNKRPFSLVLFCFFFYIGNTGDGIFYKCGIKSLRFNNHPID